MNTKKCSFKQSRNESLGRKLKKTAVVMVDEDKELPLDNYIITLKKDTMYRVQEWEDGTFSIWQLLYDTGVNEA